MEDGSYPSKQRKAHHSVLIFTSKKKKKKTPTILPPTKIYPELATSLKLTFNCLRPSVSGMLTSSLSPCAQQSHTVFPTSPRQDCGLLCCQVGYQPGNARRWQGNPLPPLHRGKGHCTPGVILGVRPWEAERDW